MNISTHTKTITQINKLTNTLSIYCFSDLNSEGGYDPSIYAARLLQFPSIIDNVNGIEGELLIGKTDENVVVELNENGELVLNAYHEPSSRYSKGGNDDVDLIYNRPNFIPNYNNNYSEDYLHNQQGHIIDNVLSNVGDSIVVNVNSVVTGKVRLLNFVENFTGITANRYVSSKFRISTDGIFWSDWNNFTISNISQYEYETENNLKIEIKYTREGSDTSGEITFVDINFTGTWEEVLLSMPTIENSMFNGLIGTPEFIQLENNIFKKLYYRGIVPDYIKRAENRSYNEDEDYIEFTKSIARFFTMIFMFFKRWENFSDNNDMLREQLRSYGINFDESRITFEELKELCENIYSDIASRGTSRIFDRKGKLLPNMEQTTVDGELIRLFRNTVNDELLYEVIPTNKSGWCLGQCSPMYRGTCGSIQLNKTKENTKDFQDINNFVICGDVTNCLFDDKRVLKITCPNGTNVSGLGRFGNEDVKDKLYVADANLDYEITFDFLIKQKTIEPFYDNFLQDSIVSNNQVQGQNIVIDSDLNKNVFVYEIPKYSKIKITIDSGVIGSQNYSIVISDLNNNVIESFDMSNAIINYETNEKVLVWITDVTLDNIEYVSSSGRLKFEVEGFNINKIKFNDAFSKINGNNSSERFFSVENIHFKNNVWYSCRGIIHSYNSENFSMKTNLGFGTNLLFNNPFTKYILPKIQLENNYDTCELYLWNYKIRPLIRGKNIIKLKDGKENSFSLGFIECSNLSHTYIRNNNNNQSIDSLIDIIEKYLYNYETLDLFTILSNF